MNYNAKLSPEQLAQFFAIPRKAHPDAYFYLKNPENMNTLVKMLTDREKFADLEYKIVQQTPLSVVDLVYEHLVKQFKIEQFDITDTQWAALGIDQQRYLLRLAKQ